MKITLRNDPAAGYFRQFGLPETISRSQTKMVSPKLEKLLLVVSLMFLPFAGFSQDKDTKGNVFEKIIGQGGKSKSELDGFPGKVILKDTWGKGVANYRKDIFGNVIEEDEVSKKQKVYKKNIFGETVVEDEKGRTVATFKKDIFGNDIEEYDNGKKRVYKKNIFGDTVVEDEHGKVLGTYKKDISGNTVFDAN